MKNIQINQNDTRGWTYNPHLIKDYAKLIVVWTFLGKGKYRVEDFIVKVTVSAGQEHLEASLIEEVLGSQHYHLICNSEKKVIQVNALEKKGKVYNLPKSITPEYPAIDRILYEVFSHDKDVKSGTGIGVKDWKNYLWFEDDVLIVPQVIGASDLIPGATGYLVATPYRLKSFEHPYQGENPYDMAHKKIAPMGLKRFNHIREAEIAGLKRFFIDHTVFTLKRKWYFFGTYWTAKNYLRHEYFEKPYLAAA